MSILKIFLLSILLIGIVVVNENAQAHPGKTDSFGCHTCRTNCSSWGLSSGEYHCHNAKTSAPQPIEPIKSIYGEDGTGHTEPAPEYKIPQDNIETNKISESKPIEADDNSKNIPSKGADSADSLLGFLVILALIGGVGYFIGKRKSSK